LAIMFSVLGAFLIMPAASVFAQSSRTVLTRQPDFDSRSLIAGGENSVSGFSLTNPRRFSMQQSYSLTAVSGGAGTMSTGTYLNTLGYKISDPLFLFVDVGIATPMYSSVQGVNGNTGAAASSVILPRMGLEYRPSDRLTFNLELINVRDAWKAGYGYGGYPSFFGSRAP
jgi:hypothetical protein